jgi:hypothetical protein
MADPHDSRMEKAGATLFRGRCRTISLLALLTTSKQVLAEWDGRGFHSDGNSGSVFVLLLGAIHALPILFIAYKTHSKALTIVTAIVMAVIGVLVGGSKYALIDLIFVGLGTYAAFQLHIPALAETHRAPLKVESNPIPVSIMATEVPSPVAPEFQLGVWERTKSAYETARDDSRKKRIQDVQQQAIARARSRGIHLVFDDDPLSEEEVERIKKTGLKVCRISVPPPASSNT